MVLKIKMDSMVDWRYCLLQLQIVVVVCVVVVVFAGVAVENAVGADVVQHRSVEYDVLFHSHTADYVKVMIAASWLSDLVAEMVRVRDEMERTKLVGAIHGIPNCNHRLELQTFRICDNARHLRWIHEEI